MSCLSSKNNVLKLLAKLTFLILIAQKLHYAVGSSAPQRQTFYMRSIQSLKSLAQKDISIAKALEATQSKISQKSHLYSLIKRYIQDYIDCHGNPDVSDEKVREITHNPVSVYRLIRRTAYLLREVVDEVSFNGGIVNLPEGAHSLNTTDDLPVREDLEDAIDVILRLHLVYNLNVIEVANGNIRGDTSSVKLKAFHLHEIGAHATSKGLYALAVDWLKAAEKYIYEDQTLDIVMLRNAISDLMKIHNDEFTKSGGTNPNLLTEKFSTINDWKRDIPKKRDELYQSDAKSRDGYQPATYWGLCSGEDLRSENIKRHLFCWTESKIHPFFTIGPLKMEFLARDPDVVQIYEVFSDVQIDKFISVAGLLTPSRVVDIEDKSGSGTVLSNERTSAMNFIDDSTPETRFIGKSALITGLKITGNASEYTQVSSYTVGGHYEAHIDSLLYDYIWGSQGDRIATFMAYLTDVERGGYTAFPKVFAAAVPVKGSAVFWYNIYSDGTTDHDTLHGACPVLLGQKWVANKWILLFDQLLRRKCSLQPHQRFQIPVNGKYIPVPSNIYEEYENRPNSTMKADSDQQDSVGYAYTSIPGLRSLAKMEWEIYQKLFKISNASQSRMSNEDDYQQSLCVSSYHREFHHTSTKVEDYVDIVTSNALASFKMYWRFRHYLRHWLSNNTKYNSDVPHDTVLLLREVYNVTTGPTEQDLRDAMQGIINIQFVYDLKAKHIAAGRVICKNTGVSLSAVQCFFISTYAQHLGYFYIAVDWMETALEKIRRQNDTSMEEYTAALLLHASKQLHDEMYELSEGWEPQFYNRRLIEVDNIADRKTRKLIQYAAFKRKKEPNYAEVNYWGMCQGRPHQSAQEQRNLFCWYETQIHPSWRIGPLKVEILSVNPDMEIVQYHDILPESVMENLTSIPPGTLKREGPENLADMRQWTEMDVSETRSRLFSSSWIPQSRNKVAFSVANLIGRITGLEVLGDPNEDLLISSFPPGGHHEVRQDSWGYDVDSFHTRLATFMIYLSDGMRGGGSAFPQAGVHVLPKRGSAVFWYNLQSSGELDDYTWHGECPVIFGVKWVATKWISYTRQSWLRCHRDHMRYEVLVNGKSKYL